MNPPPGSLYLSPDTASREALSDAQLFTLHEVVQAVARQSDARDTLNLLAEKARALAGAASAAITLLDPTRTLLDFAAVAGADAADIVGQTVRVEDALAGQTALTGEIYLAHHPTQSRPLLATLAPGQSEEWGVRAAVVVPIYQGGRPAGALTAINRTDGASFGPADVLRLQILANAAALALSHDNLKAQVARRQRERDILFQAAGAASSSLNVQEVMASVLSTVAGTLQMTAGAVFLLNDERSRLYVGADIGLSEDDRDRQMPTDGPGASARALSSGQPVLVSDAAADEADADIPLPGMRSLLVAPMLARGVAEGVLVIGSRLPGAYSWDDAGLLSAVAGQAAIALENAWLYEDATRRAQEAAALYELSQSVGATLQLDRVLHFVADSVLSLLHVDKFALFLLEPRTQTLEIKVARNIRRETWATMRPKMGEGIAGWVAEFETPTAVQDVAADHRNRSCPIDGEGVTSLVSVPLQAGDAVIGVLHACSSRRRLFTVGEMELLYTIANQVGAAIANAQMYEEARHQSEEIRKGIRRVARALGSSLSPAETAQGIATLATETLGADRCLLHVREDGRLRVKAASNVRGLLPEPLPADEGGRERPADWVARRGRSLALENAAADPRFAPPPFQSRVGGYMGVPLRLGPDVLGVLEVYTRAVRRFSPDEMRLLITFASQAAVALQNALLVEQAGRRLNDLKALSVISERLAENAPLVGILELLADATQAHAARLSAPGDPETVWPDGPFDVDAVELSVSLPGAPGGTLTLARPLSAPAFDDHDRRLAATVANLLAARFAPAGSKNP